MRNGVYYWQAADRIVYLSYGRIINILSENGEIDGMAYNFLFDIERTRSRMPKTLVYLGDL